MMASDHQLSAYESRRAQNIVRNNKRLRELGLISTLEEERSNAAAWGVFSEKVISEEDQTADWKPAGSGETTATSSKRKRRAVSEKRHIKSPARKSARLQGIGPEGGDAHNLTEEERSKERQAMIQECREARQRAAVRMMDAGVEKAAKENPTATYEHCLMRVRTMNKAGLLKRVKAIERAAGKFCVVKMAVFKSCLQDEGLWDIAEEASDALERLKGLQAPPELM